MNKILRLSDLSIGDTFRFYGEPDGATFKYIGKFGGRYCFEHSINGLNGSYSVDFSVVKL